MALRTIVTTRAGLGREAAAPVGEDGRQVEGAGEPRRAVAHPREVAAIAPAPTLLDALLPAGGGLPGQVAGGVHDVELTVAKVAPEAGDLLGLGRGEDLVADDHGSREAKWNSPVLTSGDRLGTWTWWAASDFALRASRSWRYVVPVLGAPMFTYTLRLMSGILPGSAAVRET